MTVTLSSIKSEVRLSSFLLGKVQLIATWTWDLNIMHTLPGEKNNKKKIKSSTTADYNYFWKDHVTLKTGVMAAENSALHHMKKIHFAIY